MPTTFLKNPVSVNVASTAESLHVTGTAPLPTSGQGAQPPNTMTVAGTSGQDTTGIGQSAGAGANVSITAGAGGGAPAGSTNGAGGSVSINPGTPGSGAGTAAAYGNVLLATTGGQVGVGTSSPQYLFHAQLDQDASTSMVIRNANATASASGVLRVKADVGELQVQTFSSTSGGTIGGINKAKLKLINDNSSAANSNGLLINTSNSNPLYFGTNGTERVRIDGAGRVGIGTTSPGSTLHVNGGVQVGAPTGGDMGVGTINVSGDIYKNGTSRARRGRVVDSHFNGSSETGYAGLTPLAQLEDAVKTHRTFPRGGDQPPGVFGEVELLGEKLEEAYLYIIELTRRVERLEAALLRSSS